MALSGWWRLTRPGTDETMGGMDYKTLLSKYIEHVGGCEGETFIDASDYWPSVSDVEFTDEEWAELQALHHEGPLTLVDAPPSAS